MFRSLWQMTSHSYNRTLFSPFHEFLQHNQSIIISKSKEMVDLAIKTMMNSYEYLIETLEFGFSRRAQHSCADRKGRKDSRCRPVHRELSNCGG